MIAVLDTNIFVSGLIARPASPRAILERFRDGAFTVAISPSLLGELVDVLARPPLRRLIPHQAIEEPLADLREDDRRGAKIASCVVI